MAPTDSAQAMATARPSWRSTCSSADPTLTDDGGDGQSDLVEGDDREPTGHVDDVHGGQGHAGRAGRHEHLGEPGPGATGDQQVVGAGGRLDRALDSVEDDVVALHADLEGDAPEPVVRWRLAEAPRGHRRPRQQAGGSASSWPVSLRVAATTLVTASGPGAA